MHLEDLPTYIENPQKICDITDWYDPRLDYIIKNHLRAQPAPHRRQWEFAMIFKALFEQGKLTPDSIGLGMGTGTERLIYSLAEQVKKVVATDLYNPDSKWVGVRTEDPKAYILERAPFEVDPDRLDVLDMDMRNITFPDSTFDFAWSTGAIEHIGNDKDFIQHFTEVNRTLKEGGVYAFTTAVIFDKNSARIPGNHYFSPEHLVGLIDASPLHAEPIFDCSLEENRFNQPISDHLQDYGLAIGRVWTPQVIILRRGIVTAANLMVLRKDSSRPKQQTSIVGWEDSKKFVKRSLNSLSKRMWKDWQYLDAFSGVSSLKLKTGQEFIEKGKTLFQVHPQFFGPGKIEVKFLFFAEPKDEKAEALEILVESRSRGWPLDEKSVLTQKVDVPAQGLQQTVEISFSAEESRCYIIKGQTQSGKIKLPNIAIFARKKSD